MNDCFEQLEAPEIQRIKVGDKICITEEKEDCGKVAETYTVVSVSRRTVLTKNKKGIKRTFSYGDLVVLQMEWQQPEMEALKMQRDMESDRNGNKTNYGGRKQVRAHGL